MADVLSRMHFTLSFHLLFSLTVPASEQWGPFPPWMYFETVSPVERQRFVDLTELDLVPASPISYVTLDEALEPFSFSFPLREAG